MSSPSRSPTLSTVSNSSPKTSIIISNLDKDDFVKPAKDCTKPQLISKKLSLVDQIKLSVLNHDENVVQHITYWSVLPFLHRIIIIFDKEFNAKANLQYLDELLSKQFPYIKLSLQENLLQKSKSQDQIDGAAYSLTETHLNVTKSLANFRSFHNDPTNEDVSSLSFASEYVEPAPAQFNVISDLSKLGIDLSQYNSDEQLNELKQDEEESRANQANNTQKTSRSGSISASASGSRSRSPSSLSPVLPQGSPAFASPSPSSTTTAATTTGSTNSDMPMRRRSTKTLFKPDLKVKTSGISNNNNSNISTGATNLNVEEQAKRKKSFPFDEELENFPSSPTITLDETF